MFFFLISSLSFRFFSTPPPNHFHCVLLFLNSLEVLGNSFELEGGGGAVRRLVKLALIQVGKLVSCL
jgi:hypothetical protein